MELSKVTGPDMRTALRLVREQLGPDAIILSNRRTASGVEIVASPEEGWPMASPAATPAAVPAAAPAAAPPPVGAALTQPAAAQRSVALPGERSDGEFGAVRSDLRDLRALFEQRFDAMHGEQLAWGPGNEGRAWRRLTRMGLPNDLVHALVSEIPRDAEWDTAWGLLRQRLVAGIAEAGDPVAAGGAFALVGPTGAGKTTTLCKLAVRRVLEHGPDGVVLASLDGSRIGGCDMLRALARLLGVPLHVAQDDEPAEHLLERVGPYRLLLIDTAGWNRRHAQQAYRMAALGRLAPRVASLLVVPANAQLAWLGAALRDYRHAAPVAAVITKLDETVSMGEALGALARAGMPLAYATDGQEIPDDLHVARAAALVERALQLDDAALAPDAAARRMRPVVATDNTARIA